ncbi:hypothetical protein LS482_08270 [Sinomicrobium kalidii]|uniref:hypothetical protein n=1 Tax=Sinomicrobium kalidii TaxID=2900738 RepID=UPI001E4D69D6|nr:hypothetical protein [Sinomicrobium kalidii]UGU17863.1 hypothetical protein LS482_08270 [Sinomicrobium kalidii]
MKNILNIMELHLYNIEDTEVYDFLDLWKNQEHTEGILITGSYATQWQNEQSDLDIRIILDDSCEQTLKGVYTTEKALKISYTARSVANTIRLFGVQHKSSFNFEARNICIGKIFFERTDKVSFLQEESQKIINRPFPEKSKNKLLSEFNSINTEYTKLMGMNTASPFFKLAYFSFLNNVFQCYSIHLNYELVFDIAKFEEVFFNKDYREVNIYKDFPDSKFLKDWISAISSNVESMKKNARYLYDNLLKVSDQDISEFLIQI